MPLTIKSRLPVSPSLIRAYLRLPFKATGTQMPTPDEPGITRRGLSAPPVRSLILATLPWVYALLVVVCSLTAPVGEFDDSLPLVHGSLVQQGATPTIDFSSFYPPLGPYAMAVAFNLFGKTIIAARILAGGLYLLLMVLLSLLLARHFQRFEPAFALTILLLAVVLGRAITLPAWPGFGLSAVALIVYFLSQKRDGSSLLTLGLSGVLTGLALLYRVNFGGYVVLIVAADLAIELIGCRMPGWRRVLFKGVAFAVPMLACLTVLCVGIYGQRFIDGISEFTFTSQKIMLLRGFIDLTWSFRLVLVLLFPTLWFSARLLSSTGKLSWRLIPGFALTAGVLILAVVRGHHVSVVAVLVICQLAGVLGLDFFVLHLGRLERAFLLFYVLQLHYYLSRADKWHNKFLPFAAVLLLPFLWPERVRPRGFASFLFSKRIQLAGLTALIVVIVWSQYMVSFSNVRDGINLIADVTLHRPMADAERVSGQAPLNATWAFIYSDADEIHALQHLSKVTTKSDPIFVGVQDHSRVFFNNLRIYWLSGRPIGVRRFQLEDRIATEAAVQREIIHDLDENHVKWAVIDRSPPLGDDAFVRRAYSGSTLLDAFVSKNFKEESQFGRFAILRRVSASLSQARPDLSGPFPDLPSRQTAGAFKIVPAHRR